MITSTGGSNPPGSGDEPDRPTNTEKTENNMTIKFKKLDPRAVAPVRAYNTDAGFDLTCTRITTELNECGQVVLVYHTDLAFEIPEGFFGAVVPRSSIFKKSIRLTNSVGVVDAGYRGEVTGKFMTTTDVVPAVFKEGERFAQLIILPLQDISFEEGEISEGDRGNNGYGSTGNTNEHSAPESSNGYPEQKSELTNQEIVPEGSGEAEESLEQAQ